MRSSIPRHYRVVLLFKIKTYDIKIILISGDRTSAVYLAPEKLLDKGSALKRLIFNGGSIMGFIVPGIQS